MQRAVAAAPKRRTPSAQPAAPFDAAAAPFDADTLPANKKEKYLSILHASLPAIEKCARRGRRALPALSRVR
eukprot:6981388-Prymnesium_polylepis.1